MDVVGIRLVVSFWNFAYFQLLLLLVLGRVPGYPPKIHGGSNPSKNPWGAFLGCPGSRKWMDQWLGLMGYSYNPNFKWDILGL